MLSSSDITRAKRLQIANNDLRFQNKPHNLSGIEQLCVRKPVSGELPTKSLPPDLKYLLRPTKSGTQRMNNNNPRCCGRI